VNYYQKKKQKIKNRKIVLSDQYVIEKRNLKPAHDSIYHLKYQCRYGYEIHLTNWRKHETKNERSNFRPNRTKTHAKE